jgi:hypothetical protein
MSDALCAFRASHGGAWFLPPALEDRLGVSQAARRSGPGACKIGNPSARLVARRAR